MMRRLQLLLVALFLVPALGNALELRVPVEDGFVGMIGADEAVVLRLGGPVPEGGMADAVQVTAESQSPLPLRVRAADDRLVIQPRDKWPAGVRLTLMVDGSWLARTTGRRTDLSLSLHVKPDNAALTAGMSPERSTAATGSLDNGVEVFPLPITPNRDGFNDFLHITRPDVGFTDPVVRIFTIKGIPVRTLDRNDVVRGEVLWTGADRLNHEVGPGPYFIIVEDAGDVLASGVIYVLR